ncbi:hypothetical protein CONLIGDRAFT_632904 [Coniochaeta ligniaria NRRL 30616]|uniref:Cupin 2 conserved barrel domain-containing protein n=1 Tax=Coniochaeta ligniaria NRRL 30616 TaxID=1408157 RepID=A0A1J7IN65_9PEZI|nr:hypothetical protein CONLIGDRAFT_632904 [Coniochaeta ligniaria NRRL 30616]
MSGSQETNQSRSSSSASKKDLDPLLSHSSAIGILKPGVVFNIFNPNPTSPSPSTAAASGSSSTMLPPPRLVRTTHTPTGTSVFAPDTVLVPRTPFGPQATAFTVLDIRDAVPVDLLGSQPDASQVTLPRCPPGGVIAAVSDIPAGSGLAAPPMHRTQTIDYAVVMSGEIVLGLDGGEERVVRAGELRVYCSGGHESYVG